MSEEQKDNESPKKIIQKSEVKNGDSHIAGRDVIINKSSGPSKLLFGILALIALIALVIVGYVTNDLMHEPQLVPAELELLPISPNVDRTLDIRLKNNGETTAVIHRITATILKDLGGAKPGPLSVSAEYSVSLEGLKVGETAQILTEPHQIEGKIADRFKIYLKTPRSLSLRLEIYYDNKQEPLEATVDI